MYSAQRTIVFVTVCASLALLCTATIHSSTYPAAAVGFAPDNVQAYWPLSDLPTYDSRLRNRASLYRSAGVLSSAPSQGHAVSFGAGNFVYRQSGALAIQDRAILVTVPLAYLSFPLNTVRSGPPSGPATQSFTLHGWMRYSSTGPVSPVDDSPILTSNSLFVSSSAMTFGTESPSVRSVDGEVGGVWSHFALVAVETSSSVSVQYFLNGVLEHSVVSSTPWSGSEIHLLAPSWSAVVYDEIVLAASALSQGRIADLYAAGILGPCLGKPCFSGVQCTTVSSAEFNCGACPNGYHGDGIKCYANPTIPTDYRCFPSSESDLDDETYCASHCRNRFACFSCSMYYYQIDASLQERSRSHCEFVFFSEKSPSPTASHTPTSSITASSSVTSSISQSETSSVTSSISHSATSSATSSIAQSATSSISRSRTMAPSVSRTSAPSATPSKSGLPPFRDLLTFPSGFTWYGGAGLSYILSPSFSISGEAGFSEGGRGLESNFFISGDMNIVVSVIRNEQCSDPGISIFPSQSNWNWQTDPNRIQAPIDCATPKLVGFSSSTSNGNLGSDFGPYTLRLLHQPSIGRTTFMVYSGFDVNVLTSTPVASMFISESISGSYKFGLNADQDNPGIWTSFYNLRWF